MCSSMVSPCFGAGFAPGSVSVILYSSSRLCAEGKAINQLPVFLNNISFKDQNIHFPDPDIGHSVNRVWILGTNPGLGFR
jgi:hypothetical protein